MPNMTGQEGVTLREQALEALEKSIKLLKIAMRLWSDGQTVEAKSLRDEARTHRTISTLLMAKANNLDNDFEGSDEQFEYARSRTRSRGLASVSR